MCGGIDFIALALDNKNNKKKIHTHTHKQTIHAAVSLKQIMYTPINPPKQPLTMTQPRYTPLPIRRRRQAEGEEHQPKCGQYGGGEFEEAEEGGDGVLVAEKHAAEQGEEEGCGGGGGCGCGCFVLGVWGGGMFVGGRVGVN